MCVEECLYHNKQTGAKMRWRNVSFSRKKNHQLEGVNPLSRLCGTQFMPCLHHQHLLVSSAGIVIVHKPSLQARSNPNRTCFHLLATDVPLYNLLVLVDGVSRRIPVDGDRPASQTHLTILCCPDLQIFVPPIRA